MAGTQNQMPAEHAAATVLRPLAAALSGQVFGPAGFPQMQGQAGVNIVGRYREMNVPGDQVLPVDRARQYDYDIAGVGYGTSMASTAQDSSDRRISAANEGAGATANEDAGSPDGGSAADKVADTIMRGIRAGGFVPGQHLVEPDLTRRLGISRGSLREALKHLAAAGIVTLNRFRGAYISTLDRKSVLDLLQTLEPLCRLAARLAAEHCDTPEKAQVLFDAAAAVDEANRQRNRAEYLELRRQFYTLLVEIGGNRELERVMPLSRTDLFRAQIETIQSERQRQLHASGYGKIARAVGDRDPAGAERAVQKHFAGTRKTMSELPDHAFPALG